MSFPGVHLLQRKIVSRTELPALLEPLKDAGKVIGFTSGVFDLLHAGHVSYLAAARSQCDVLVVGVNSDASVAALKGPRRPISGATHRVQVIAGLESVDYVFEFDETNNNQSVEVLSPSIYFKAGDYNRANLSSAPLVEQQGGQVQIVPVMQGCSSSATIDAILAAYADEHARSDRMEPAPAGSAIFVDRDGTLIEFVEYLHEPAKVQVKPGAFEALAKMKRRGWKVVMITNQPGIGLGYFQVEDFFRVNRVLLKAARESGLLFDKIYFCPHSDNEGCRCRKPKAGMFERARKELGVVLERSVMIGDSSVDVLAGAAAGCKTIALQAEDRKRNQAAADHYCRDVAEAVAWIREHMEPLVEDESADISQKHDPFADVGGDARTLEAIGKVCGKIGHDVNNLLASVKGGADLIQSKMKKLHPEDNPVERQLRIIRSAVDKGVSLTSRLRSYVRPGKLDRMEWHLGSCVEGVIGLLRDSNSEDIEVEVVTHSDPPVEIHEFIVTQMIMALAMNAMEAMSRLEERLVLFVISEVEAGDVEGDSLPAGRYSRLSIIDHGKGLPSESSARVMKPFFSTKPDQVGKGFGLTLPMAREVMRKHEGFLSVHSRRDCGTAVHLYFPVAGQNSTD